MKIGLDIEEERGSMREKGRKGDPAEVVWRKRG
jgi:hypothetical protein